MLKKVNTIWLLSRTLILRLPGIASAHALQNMPLVDQSIIYPANNKIQWSAAGSGLWEHIEKYENS